MTPKEKAEELFEKFLNQMGNDDMQDHSRAKQCAFICVEEILTIRSLTGGWAKELKHLPLSNSMTPYWEAVKSEIEKM